MKSSIDLLPMIKSSNLLRFLTTGKLHLIDREGSRHTSFELSLDAERVELPRLLRLGRHSGDVPDNVFRSIARALGIREQELRLATECKISRDCILLALAHY